MVQRDEPSKAGREKRFDDAKWIGAEVGRPTRKPVSSFIEQEDRHLYRGHCSIRKRRSKTRYAIVT